MARDTSTFTTSRAFTPYQPPRTTAPVAGQFADPQPAKKIKKDCGHIDFNDLSSIREACKRHCSSATKKIHSRIAEMTAAYAELTALFEDMKRQKEAVVEEVDLLMDIVEPSRRQSEVVEPKCTPAPDGIDIFGGSHDDNAHTDVLVGTDDTTASLVSDYSSEAEATAPNASGDSFGFFQAHTPSPLPVPVFQPGSQGYYATPSDAIHYEIIRPTPAAYCDPIRDSRHPEYSNEAAARGYSYKDSRTHGYNPYSFGTSQAEKSRRPQSGREIMRAAQKSAVQQSEDPTVQQVASSLDTMYLKPAHDAHHYQSSHWDRPIDWAVQ
ncbi:hypothetical protein CYLTODRAFT_459076 [Cylindrobasidium torrendii FP15055 ss-10]|uniref:Uncharacterized protein n=1 Tax=Cylindrobasidium torrendii FP15055 ss-10 TaxID=1314674 RepID=A0A0D7AVC5_9AGAR|nr:hypothetical protein CYLTODRAFT_459076 [Cylindrobasidium torrendii FP15055 ss-10]